MLDLSRLDLDEIATALADQTDYEHRWLINPDNGQIVFWTADSGIDGQIPVNLDELDLTHRPRIRRSISARGAVTQSLGPDELSRSLRERRRTMRCGPRLGLAVGRLGCRR